MPEPPLLVVDAANVVGSRPDGWWRDRAGAATRLRDELAGVAERGVVGPDGLPPPVEVVLVVEGAARRVPGISQARVVAAARELRARVTALGARVRGPGWLGLRRGPAAGPYPD